MDGAAVGPDPGADPGWLPDPWGVADQRWWDGSSWTGSTWPDAAPTRSSRRFGGAGGWGLIVAAVLAGVGLTVFGFLAYTGAFDDPKVGHVVTVEPNGDVCIRPDGSTMIYCVSNSAGLQLGPGDCVAVYDRHGIEIDRRISCPK